MTRIISGQAGSVRLTVPKRGTRPTSEKVREAVFSALDSWGLTADTRVLDLYAGSGSLGLEAVSRGAREVTLVERHESAALTLRKNAKAVRHSFAQGSLNRGAAGNSVPQIECVRMSVKSFLSMLSKEATTQHSTTTHKAVSGADADTAAGSVAKTETTHRERAASSHADLAFHQAREGKQLSTARKSAKQGSPNQLSEGSDSADRAPTAKPNVFDVVFIDPPYELPNHELVETLTALAPHLASDAAVMVERDSRSPQPEWPEALHLVREKRYGETVVYWLEPR